MNKYKRKYNTPEYRKKYTGLYGSWYAMKQRCGNPNHASFKNYGGRGIGYPKTWESFDGFKDAVGNSYKQGLTLERINNNQSYSVENCRWATKREQTQNKRCNIVIERAGVKKTLLEWWKFLGMDIKYNTLRQRYYKGMTPEKILEVDLYRPAKI